MTWRDEAACVGLFDLFFPEQGHNQLTQKAKAICVRCPVTDECLADALRFSQNAQMGVRGGLSALERKQLMSRMRRAS